MHASSRRPRRRLRRDADPARPRPRAPTPAQRHRAARRQRRRQDDADEDACRRPAGDRAGGSVCRATTSPRVPAATRRVLAGHGAGARRPAGVSGAERARQPAPRRDQPARPRRLARTRSTDVYAIFPAPARTRATRPRRRLSGGEQQMLAIGRGLMARAAPDAARRADAGPGAGDGAADVRAGPAPRRRRTHAAARRAGRRAHARASPPRLRDRERPRRHRRARRAQLAADPRIRQAYLGL